MENSFSEGDCFTNNTHLNATVVECSDTFDKQLRQIETDFETMAAILEKERNERKRMEDDAVDILKGVKQKYDDKLAAINNDFKRQLSDLREKSQNQRSEIDDLRTENDQLKRKVKSFEADIGSKSTRNEFLDDQLTNANDKNKKLSSELRSTRTALDDCKLEIISLKQKLADKTRLFDSEVKRMASEKDDLLKRIASLSEKVKRKESETKVSASIDADVVSSPKRRELWLSTSDRVGIEKWKCYEECKRENITLSAKLKELEFLNNGYKQIIEEKQKAEAEKQLIEQRWKEVEGDLKICNNKITEEKQKNEELSNQLKFVESVNNNLKTELTFVKESLKRSEMDYERLKESTDVIKETCVEMNNQTDELETMNKILRCEKETLMKEKDRLCLYMQMLTQNLESTKIELAEERNKSDNYHSQIEACRELCRKEIELKNDEIKSLQIAVSEEMQTVERMREEADILRYEMQSRDSTIDLLYPKIDQYKNELHKIKEEAAGHITTIQLLTSKNEELCEALERSVKKYEKSQSRLEETVNRMDEKECNFEREKLKLQETVNQQLKLIDFLQSKSEKQKEKKNWFGINSPKTPHHPYSMNANNAKDIETVLRQEKEKNRSLLEELNDARFQLKRCISKIKKYEASFRCDDEEQCKQRCELSHDSKIRNDENEDNFKLKSVLTSSPSAPSFFTAHCGDFDAKSTSSSVTTDNNDSDDALRSHEVEADIHDNDANFTFSESMLKELNA